MKKLLSFAVAAMMMLAVSGCGDDDDFSGNGNNNGGGKPLAKLTHVYNEGGSQTYVDELRFTYNGNQVSHAELWEDGSREWYADFTYNGTKVSEITYHEGSNTRQARFTYSGNNPSRVDLYVNGSQASTVQITSDNMGHITCVNANYGDFVMNFTWEGNNVVREEVVGEGYYTYSYDNKTNPINNTLALFLLIMEEDGYYMSANNLTYRSWNSNYGGNSSYSLNYTYTDNYPATASYSRSGGSGTYHYYYTDGTGSNYNGGSQQNYTVSVSANNSSYGYVTGGGTYPAGSTVTLTAYPYSGYQFSYWSDGNTQNPRTITVNSNVSYTAYFTTSGSGSTSVTFGSYNWGTVDPNMLYSTSYDVLYGYLYSNTSQDYPYLRLQIESPSYGTTTLIADNGILEGDYNILDYYEETMLTDNNNNYYGDWWAKNATVQFSSLNLNAGTASLTIYATMFSAYEAYIDGVGVDGASTRSLTISLPNLTFDQAKKVMTSVQNMNRRSLALRHNMTPGRLQVKR